MSIWFWLFKYSIFWLPVVTAIVYIGLYVYAKKAKKFFLGFDFTKNESMVALVLMLIPIVNTAVFCTALVALPFYLLIEGVFIIGPAIKRSLRF
jgi:hypothetical protein